MRPVTILCLLAISCLNLSAQSAPTAPAQTMPQPVQSIPAIAKAASGAIVTIITADADKPIARGTGFLVRPDGVIVTNYHVIETGNVAIVKFPDGTTLPVDGVLAADKVRDLAIIKIHGKTFRTLTLGNSDQIQVGEDVVAIGNPLGLELTVSNGILSGVRTVEKGGGKFLQVTAPISHGSSGGPLFNMAGEVVGITSMYFEGGENLNFAIPVNDAKQLLLNQSAKLQNLPNEHESAPTDAPPSTTGEGQIAQTNSPGYQYYQELLKNGDTALITATYACFDDVPQNGFAVISAHLESKQSMDVFRETFRDGVSGGARMFSGHLNPLSGGGLLFATLSPMEVWPTLPGWETDIFEWSPDELTMKSGFGKLPPGQDRATYEFKMRRSTGRYTEHILVYTEHPFTVDRSGKCIRIPNIGRTPEEEYRSLK